MRSEGVRGEEGLLGAEVVGMLCHDEAVARREAYLVSWSGVRVRGGGGWAMLRGRRKGVVGAADGFVLFTVAVSGTEDDCGCSGVADPFTCFASSTGICAGVGAAIWKAGDQSSVETERA